VAFKFLHSRTYSKLFHGGRVGGWTQYHKLLANSHLTGWWDWRRMYKTPVLPLFWTAIRPRNLDSESEFFPETNPEVSSNPDALENQYMQLHSSKYVYVASHLDLEISFPCNTNHPRISGERQQKPQSALHYRKGLYQRPCNSSRVMTWSGKGARVVLILHLQFFTVPHSKR
jgi:hypothetical protein